MNAPILTEGQIFAMGVGETILRLPLQSKLANYKSVESCVRGMLRRASLHPEDTSMRFVFDLFTKDLDVFLSQWYGNKSELPPDLRERLNGWLKEWGGTMKKYGAEEGEEEE